MTCQTCGEPITLTAFWLLGEGGVCRDPFNPCDDDEGQHIAVPLRGVA